MRRDAGYTLLEMLVALVVFGLVMAGIAQTYRFGLTAWSASGRNAAGPENMAALDAALSRMIADAQPGTMTGRPDGVAFATRLPPGSGVSGLADTAILLAPDGTLTLRYGPHPPGVPLKPAPPPRTEPLASNVAGLSISYFGPGKNGTPVWAGTWKGQSLPLLLRIHLQFAGGQEWPDLVAAPAQQGN